MRRSLDSCPGTHRISIGYRSRVSIHIYYFVLLGYNDITRESDETIMIITIIRRSDNVISYGKCLAALGVRVPVRLPSHAVYAYYVRSSRIVSRDGVIVDNMMVTSLIWFYYNSETSVSRRIIVAGEREFSRLFLSSYIRRTSDFTTTSRLNGSTAERVRLACKYGLRICRPYIGSRARRCFSNRKSYPTK